METETLASADESIRRQDPEEHQTLPNLKLLLLLYYFLCSISALHLKTVLLQDVHQLLMLSAGTLMYFKQILFPLVIFYNNCVTIHILDINYIQLYKFADLVSCLLVSVLHVFFPF
jgi:hypothetical protein